MTKTSNVSATILSQGSNHRCGTVAIVGRPNVGKSTLLNRFLGQKIAIVSPKPETTRDRLLGILTRPNAQILFLDTPGIYKGAKTLLAKHQIQAAREALSQADALILVTEATAGFLDEDRQILSKAPRGEAAENSSAVYLAINKIDRIDKKLLLAQIDQARRLYPFREIVPISAQKGDHVDSLLKAVLQALPIHPPLYPPEQITDRPLRLLAQDLIREKTLLMTHEEIPYAVAVVVEEWRQGAAREGPSSGTPRPTYIRATLYVEREGQKGILIGKEGRLLKRIGQDARWEMEKLIEGPVFLDLWVKVARDWRKDPVLLKRLGY